MRASGILLPITSLPSPYGIGCFSKEAYTFIDFLAQSGQKYWQVLPLGPTGYGDSPYQSFSTFAGNPYFVDLEELIDKGWLSKADCQKAHYGDNLEYVDYEKIYFCRFKLLEKAYKKSGIEANKDYKAFVRDNSFWLDDYALYMAIKNHFKGGSYAKWPDDIRLRKVAALKQYKEDKKINADVNLYKFIQYMFYSQWAKLKAYANEKGIEIIGDIPIYVAYDSADTWANPKLFMLDKDNTPIAVAGTPPDCFSETGQLWGNPLYNWDYHKKTNYDWWVKRIEHCFKMYDIVRIDHFRGFDEYYSIPYGDSTALNGKWMKGPGFELFDTLRKRLGKQKIIAEDLGFLTDSVIKLVKKCGYPGMKILEFAFDSDDTNAYLPHNYDKNCIVYTATHDNSTILGWYEDLPNKTKKNVRDYLGGKGTKNIVWDLIRLAHSSIADTSIIPMQDYLALGKEATMNVPSTLGGNWTWRLEKDALTDELAKKIKAMVRLYSR